MRQDPNSYGHARADYRGGGLVNLMRSLVEGLGGGTTLYPPLEVLTPAEVAEAAHVVFWLIDGLGYRYLTEQAARSRLHAHLRGAMTSVFPATTASAITTIHTAVAPQQHAVTGWYVYLREVGTVTAILPARPRFGGAPLDRLGIEVADLIKSPPFFPRLGVESHIVLPKPLMHSGYNSALTSGAKQVGYSQVVEAVAQIARLASGRTKRYIYAYTSSLDSLSHEYGANSEIVALHLAELDRAFAWLLDRLQGTGTLVIVSADHGFIDTRPEDVLRIEHHPELASCLALPLSGESRAAYCYVRQQRADPFERYARDRLADACTLHRSEDLLAQGWFGQGPVAPALAERIGDYMLLAKGHTVIRDQILGQKPFDPLGVHGGTSEAEMRVPLIVASA